MTNNDNSNSNSNINITSIKKNKIIQFLLHSKQKIIRDSNEAFKVFVKGLQKQDFNSQNISQNEVIAVNVKKNQNDMKLSQPLVKQKQPQQERLLQNSKINLVKKTLNKQLARTKGVKLQTPIKMFSRSEMKMSKQKEKSFQKITSKSSQNYKLVQLTKKKSFLMQKLKEIDKRLEFQQNLQKSEVKVKNKSYIYNRVQESQNTESNAMIISQKINDKQTQKQKYSPRTYRNYKIHPELIFRPQISSMSKHKYKYQNQQQQRIQNPQTPKPIQLNLQVQHKKAIQMLRKLHQQKMMRQQKLLQKIRKKQQNQIKKLKQLKSLKQGQIAKSRARGLFISKSNPHKNKNQQKQSQKSVFTQKNTKIYDKNNQTDNLKNFRNKNIKKNFFTQVRKIQKPKAGSDSIIQIKSSNNSKNIDDDSKLFLDKEKGKTIFNSSKIDEEQDQNLYQNQNFQQNQSVKKVHDNADDHDNIIPLTLDKRQQKQKSNKQLQELQDIMMAESYDKFNQKIENQSRMNLSKVELS